MFGVCDILQKCHKIMQTLPFFCLRSFNFFVVCGNFLTCPFPFYIRLSCEISYCYSFAHLVTEFQAFFFFGFGLRYSFAVSRKLLQNSSLVLQIILINREIFTHTIRSLNCLYFSFFSFLF